MLRAAVGWDEEVAACLLSRLLGPMSYPQKLDGEGSHDLTAGSLHERRRSDYVETQEVWVALGSVTWASTVSDWRPPMGFNAAHSTVRSDSSIENSDESPFAFPTVDAHHSITTCGFDARAWAMRAQTFGSERVRSADGGTAQPDRHIWRLRGLGLRKQ